MCIVSFVNLGEEKVLTHTRDENENRPFSHRVEELKDGETKHLYLKDLKAGGTWMMSYPNAVACILNGGENSPLEFTTYPNSRGELLFLLANDENINDFLENDFEDFAPFTLLYYNWEIDNLLQIRWEDKSLQIQDLPTNKDRVWFSSTLYSLDRKKEKQSDFKLQTFKNIEEIRNWHKKHKMKRGDVHTSIKSVCLSQLNFDLNEKTAHFSLELLN